MFRDPSLEALNAPNYHRTDLWEFPVTLEGSEVQVQVQVQFIHPYWKNYINTITIGTRKEGNQS